MGRIIPYIMENISQCSKPPTRYIYIYIYYDICFLVKWGIPKPHSGFLKWFRTRSFNTQMDFRTWLGSFEEPAWIQFCFMPFTSSSTPTWNRAGKSPLWSSESKGFQGANERKPFIFGALFVGEKPYFLVTFSLKSIHERILSPWKVSSGHRWPQEQHVGICLFSAPGSTVASSHISIWGWVKTLSPWWTSK